MAEALTNGNEESKVEITLRMMKMRVDKDIIFQATGVLVEDIKR